MTTQTIRRSKHKLQSSPSGYTTVRDDDQLKPECNSLLQLDVLWTESLSICANTDSKYGFLRPLMKLLEISGHGIPWLASPFIYVYAAGVAKSNREIAMNLLLGLVIDLVLTAAIKALVRRPRPNSNKMDMFATVSVDHFSFPSGHSSRACMLLAFFISEMTFSSPFSYILLTVWSLGVCMSRLFLGRHHISDIGAGMILGFIEYALLKQLWIPAQQCDELMQYFGLLP
ncbi:polyisoprenoid diphosphate/phosphate phosphohydrolase PLPP6-like [Ptychodera flava]|uniref:polyisoprenoid diphosphate/phosphate phosphohydrolase PLPP6-like n=1 Tax=Ptychodera flava TaxID=63121 RepID=UPI00396A3C9C